MKINNIFDENGKTLSDVLSTFLVSLLEFKQFLSNNFA